MILHDVEVYKDKQHYKISDNPFTLNMLRVVSYDVKGAGYNRDFSDIDRVNGRFHNATNEIKKTVEMKLRYDVQKIGQASFLKARIQELLRGHFYLRELAASETEIKFENIFEPKNQQPTLEYVDGRQIYVGLVNEISFDTTQISGEIDVEFETIELPYFESIGYSTDLEKETNNINKWGAIDTDPFEVEQKYRNYTFYDLKIGDVYYGGSVPIKQFNQDSVVELTLGEDISKDDRSGLTFYITNGSNAIKISGLDIKAGDVIRFDGIHTYRNKIRIDDYNQTKTQPVLVPGWNTFHSTKTLQKITFKHKRYYM